mgnify:CR=1 FL=1
MVFSDWRDAKTYYQGFFEFNEKNLYTGANKYITPFLLPGFFILLFKL